MSASEKKGRRRKAGVVVAGAMAGAVTLGMSVLPAGLAAADTVSGTSASFDLGILTVKGDAQDNSIVVGRNVAGALLVNGGAVPISGDVPTVANTVSITMIGDAGSDHLSLDETNGALPKATLIGGTGDDTLTGGSGDDVLIGQVGNDVLLGKGAPTCSSVGPTTTPSPAVPATTRTSVKRATT
jgi:Ca2+-binding RTX toxin-like protein